MTTQGESYQLIEKQSDLEAFYKTNRKVNSMCFDTEFVGEKRFVTRICLIQVTTSHGNYLIDPFSLKDLSPFLELVQDTGITTITHAGDNDYRLLFQQYDVVPGNVFDTQIAAGLAGYKYPVSLRRLVAGELNRRLKKGYTVADWESRPFKSKQLRYALNDVVLLYPLWRSLERKLRDLKREQWAEEEFRKWEEADFYVRDPNSEALGSRLIQSLRPKEQVFLIRLYDWRRRLAQEKNYSKEMILPKKMISHIVRTIQSGQDALRNNRRIPKRIANKYGDTFEALFKQEISKEEKRLLQRIERQDAEDPEGDILLEMLYLVVKYKCIKEQISTNLVLPRGLLKKLKTDAGLVEEELGDGWRGEFLGDTIIRWLMHYDQLDIAVAQEEIRLLMDSEKE